MNANSRDVFLSWFAGGILIGIGHSICAGYRRHHCRPAGHRRWHRTETVEHMEYLTAVISASHLNYFIRR